MTELEKAQITLHEVDTSFPLPDPIEEGVPTAQEVKLHKYMIGEALNEMVELWESDSIRKAKRMIELANKILERLEILQKARTEDMREEI